MSWVVGGGGVPMRPEDLQAGCEWMGGVVGSGRVEGMGRVAICELEAPVRSIRCGCGCAIQGVDVVLRRRVSSIVPCGDLTWRRMESGRTGAASWREVSRGANVTGGIPQIKVRRCCLGFGRLLPLQALGVRGLHRVWQRVWWSEPARRPSRPRTHVDARRASAVRRALQ